MADAIKESGGGGEPSNPPAVALSWPVAEKARIALGGDWRSRAVPPGLAEAESVLRGRPGIAALEFEAAGLGSWDSRLLAVLNRWAEICQARGIVFHVDGLPPGIQRLIQLAAAVPEKKDARRNVETGSGVTQLGQGILRSIDASVGAVRFVGDCTIALWQLVRGKARFRWPDVAVIVQESGAEALPIVSLINFLVGMILGFVGAVQLKSFGASIYVADMVGIAMVREMGCIMTGIIMSGRTGAAFAAQLGTMKVNEEIDAFRSFGISPVEFLVLPRILALVLMMPLLCIFANLLGIAGGFFVSILMLDLSFTEYWNETVAAIDLTSLVLGVVKGAFFGVLIATAGCLRGMQCGNNAAAVGLATTSAVVTGITCIIVADAVFAVVCNVLGI